MKKILRPALIVFACFCVLGLEVLALLFVACAWYDTPEASPGVPDSTSRDSVSIIDLFINQKTKN